MKNTIFNKTNPYFHPEYIDEKYDYNINKFVEPNYNYDYIYWRDVFNNEMKTTIIEKELSNSRNNWRNTINNEINDNIYTINIEKYLPNDYIENNWRYIIKDILHSRNIKSLNRYKFTIDIGVYEGKLARKIKVYM